MTKSIGWNFDNSYLKLPNVFSTKIKPEKINNPKIILKNHNLSKELGLNFNSLNDEELSMLFSGSVIPKETTTFSQAYAGHQFGNFTILGDGRAHILGEHITPKKFRFDVQFKGSGKTPYSRSGDGKAALGPMLREYIVSEAMYNLKIPSTRSLALVATGEKVFREKELQGAILTRVAKSHIRVGTFQFIAYQRNIKDLKTLVNYTIDRHYPHIKNDKLPIISLINELMKKQIELVVNWMRVGFIHGVMNTDNMAVSGETIDYGPCAFMDHYNPETVFSSIDFNGRYAFYNQPVITQWNLLRFAECLLPFLNEEPKKAIEIAEETINKFGNYFKTSWLIMMSEKIGINSFEENDEKLIMNLLSIMEKNKLDFTNTFRNLDPSKESEIKELNDWNNSWKQRLIRQGNDLKKSKQLMDKKNPYIIPRNHKVEEALEAANIGNFNEVEKILKALSCPYDNLDIYEEYSKPPNKIDKDYKTFCGT